MLADFIKRDFVALYITTVLYKIGSLPANCSNLATLSPF